MEMNASSSGPSAGGKVWWMILCLGAGALAVLIWPVYLLLPALLANAMFRAKPRWLILPAALSFAAAYGLYADWLMAACLTALAVLPAIAIYWMQKRRMGNAYTVAVSAGLSLVALYCMVCLPGILAGEGAFRAVQDAFAESFSYMREALDAMPAELAQMTEPSREYLDAFEDALPSLVVPALCAMASVLGLANLLFFRLFARKRGFGLSKLRPFSDWEIPRSMTGGLVLLLVAALVMRLFDWEFAASFSATVNVILGFPLILQGLALLDFFLKRAPNRRTMIRTFTFIAVGLLFTLLQTMLMLVGCLEQIFRLRERIRGAKPPSIPSI